MYVLQTIFSASVFLID